MFIPTLLVADFGISKLKGKEESRIVTRLQGTEGNLALEQAKGDSSKKKFPHFPKIVAEKLREGKLLEIVDERLVEDGGIKRKLKKNGLCSFVVYTDQPKLRLSMIKVVEMLEGCVKVGDPPETKMFLADLLSTDADNRKENDFRAYAPIHGETCNPFAHSYAFSRFSAR